MSTEAGIEHNAMLWRFFLTLATLCPVTAVASYTGFSYDESAPFSSQFAAAKQLQGTDGIFSSARLYTTIVSDGDHTS